MYSGLLTLNSNNFNTTDFIMLRIYIYYLVYIYYIYIYLFFQDKYHPYVTNVHYSPVKMQETEEHPQRNDARGVIVFPLLLESLISQSQRSTLHHFIFWDCQQKNNSTSISWSEKQQIQQFPPTMTYLLLPTAGVDNDECAMHSEVLENAMDDVHGGVFWTNS